MAASDIKREGVAVRVTQHPVVAAAADRAVDGPWRHVGAPPHAPLRASLLRALFRAGARRLPVRVAGDGAVFGSADTTAPVLYLRRPSAFYRRIAADGLIGFGESYMACDWDPAPTTTLADLLTPLARNIRSLVPTPVQALRGFWQRRQPASERNDRAGARANIARHYDLSNELFALFLDETMMYSSAIWPDDEHEAASPDDLAAAQTRKVNRLLDLAAVTSRSRVLEIGTGWGYLAITAAKRGAHVTTLTVSREQQELARQRAQNAGLADRVDVQLCDYRDAAGSYDAVVSVEMIEAVGEQYWPAYFRAIDNLLAPSGRVGIQAITIDHDRYLATRHGYTWIHKYVFPGGILPSMRAIHDVVRKHTTLRVASACAYGQHYARTLHEWGRRFAANAPAVRALGFDERFERMWRFYLAYCEAGFRSGYIDVHQILLDRAH